MYLIKIKDQNYWTEKYTEDGIFIKFETKSKEGKVQKHILAKDTIEEIVETEVD